MGNAGTVLWRSSETDIEGFIFIIISQNSDSCTGFPVSEQCCLGFDLIYIFQTDDFIGRRNMSKFVCHFMPPDHFRIRAIYYNTFCY